MRNWLSKTKLNQNLQNLPFENYLRRTRWPTLFLWPFWPLEMTKNDLKFQNVEFASFYFNRWLPVNGSQIWVGWSRNDFNRCKKIGETFFIPNWEESKTRNSHSRKPIYFDSRLNPDLSYHRIQDYAVKGHRGENKSKKAQSQLIDTDRLNHLKSTRDWEKHGKESGFSLANRSVFFRLIESIRPTVDSTS